MLTQKELKRKIEYNPETGEFFRKLKSGKKLINNRPNKDGYILIGVAGGGVPQQLAHRLAFLYMTEKYQKSLTILIEIQEIIVGVILEKLLHNKTAEIESLIISQDT